MGSGLGCTGLRCRAEEQVGAVGQVDTWGRRVEQGGGTAEGWSRGGRDGREEWDRKGG